MGCLPLAVTTHFCLTRGYKRLLDANDWSAIWQGLERHLTVLCINQIVPSYVVVQLNSFEPTRAIVCDFTVFYLRENSYLTIIKKHLMRLTLLPSGEYLRHHKGFERGFQGVNLMGQKVPIYHALSGCKPVKHKSMYKICWYTYLIAN